MLGSIWNVEALPERRGRFVGWQDARGGLGLLLEATGSSVSISIVRFEGKPKRCSWNSFDPKSSPKKLKLDVQKVGLNDWTWIKLRWFTTSLFFSDQHLTLFAKNLRFSPSSGHCMLSYPSEKTCCVLDLGTWVPIGSIFGIDLDRHSVWDKPGLKNQLSASFWPFWVLFSQLVQLESVGGYHLAFAPVALWLPAVVVWLISSMNFRWACTCACLATCQACRCYQMCWSPILGPDIVISKWHCTDIPVLVLLVWASLISFVAAVSSFICSRCSQDEGNAALLHCTKMWSRSYLRIPPSQASRAIIPSERTKEITCFWLLSQVMTPFHYLRSSYNCVKHLCTTTQTNDHKLYLNLEHLYKRWY